jgi:hypothetical protein
MSDPPATPSKGPTIDVIFNLSGGRYWNRRQRPLRGPTIDVLQELVAVASIHFQRFPGGHW